MNFLKSIRSWIQRLTKKKDDEAEPIITITVRFGGRSPLKHSEMQWAKFVQLGKALVGKPYVFGAEVDPKITDPAKISSIDCSELVEWLYAQFGLTVPDGSYNQAKVCNKIVAPILLGDLAFKANPDNGVVHHVGVYVGDNQILEAKGKAWGVILTPVTDFMASSHFAFWGRLKQIQDA